MRRTAVAFLSVCLLMTVLSTGERAMGNNVSITCTISGTQLDPDFDWLEASFGFSMQFTDETVTIP